MSRHFDSIVVGAGQAGPALAARLAEAGQTVALVDRDRLGGTCVNTGCTPTKTLVASAHVAHLARRARDYGIVLPRVVEIDMPAVMARKNAEVARHHDGLRHWLGGLASLTWTLG